MESTRIEELCDELLQEEQRHRDACQTEYYLPLAAQQELPQKEQELLRSNVRQEVETLKRAAGKMQLAHFQASAVADELETRLREGQNSEKKRPLLLRNPPANSVIDFEEELTDHFAQGTNFYKVALLMLIGSFAGVVVELMWCLMRNGYLESRSAVMYGPFNPLYGIGAVALTLALYRFRNRSSIYSFAGGMLVGSVVEYVCSWLQETLLGSTSWDYSQMPFNLNGRICLLYSVFWGILGMLWMKNIYPRVAKWILKIPNRGGRALTIVLTVLLSLDCVITAAAVFRWSERVYQKPAVSAADTFFDRHFPDERMERVFANMEFQNTPDAPGGTGDISGAF